MGKKKRAVKAQLKADRKAGHNATDQQLMHEVWNEASGMTLHEATAYIHMIETKFNVRIK